MAFKLKTGKTINKFLAGIGIASLGTIILSAVAPGIVGTTAGKVIEGAAAYGVGGLGIISRCSNSNVRRSRSNRI